MAAKKIWVTAVPGDGPEIREFTDALQKYGFRVEGTHRWQAGSGGWEGLVSPLLGRGLDAWIVCLPPAAFGQEELRYALSMSRIVLSAGGALAPLVFLGIGDRPGTDGLDLLADAPVFSTGEPWPAKLVAALARPRRAVPPDYRLAVHPLPGDVQCFEVGPRAGEWPGVLFGVSGGLITHHGVGTKGEAPSRSVVEYPVEGMKAEIAGREFGLWSVRNRLGPDESYYVMVRGRPGAVVFAGHPGTGGEEVYHLRLS